MNPEILFLITARGGSKGVPRKNLRKIEGISLIGFKAISAAKSKYCSRLIISSESEEIQKNARQYGVEVPFNRPDVLASDTASSEMVIKHAIEYFETIEHRQYDAIMLLEPSSPFARANDFNAAVELYLAKQASLVVGMRETEVNSIFIGPMEENGSINELLEQRDQQNDLRRQAMRTEYTMNGALYLIKWDAFKKTGKIAGDPTRSFGYLMDRAHSLEIDSLIDLEFAQYLVNSGRVNMEDWV